MVYIFLWAVRVVLAGAVANGDRGSVEVCESDSAELL